MASEKITAIVESVKTMTVLELKELVDTICEEFGVSAVAAAVGRRSGRSRLRRDFRRAVQIPAQPAGHAAGARRTAGRRGRGAMGYRSRYFQRVSLRDLACRSGNRTDGARAAADRRIQPYGLLSVAHRPAEFVDDLQQFFEPVHALRDGDRVDTRPVRGGVHLVRMARDGP